MTEEPITPQSVHDKILKLGFTVIDTLGEKEGVHYSRQTVVGAPPDADGDRIYVFVSVRPDGLIDVALTSPNRHGWVNIEYTDLQPEFVFRNLKTIERQIVYAWRELAD